MDKWISTEDQLPECGETVLFFIRSSREIFVGSYEWYDPGYKWYGKDGIDYPSWDVTEWMPLPKAPV